jgi:hypothetical protein
VQPKRQMVISDEWTHGRPDFPKLRRGHRRQLPVSSDAQGRANPCCSVDTVWQAQSSAACHNKDRAQSCRLHQVCPNAEPIAWPMIPGTVLTIEARVLPLSSDLEESFAANEPRLSRSGQQTEE